MAALCRGLGDAAADAQALHRRLGDAAAPLKPRIDSELANHLGFVDRALQGRDWLVGGAADRRRHPDELRRRSRARPARQYPAMDAWVRRFQATPAYQRALERGGPYAMAG
jgi:glutathione S-transferase